MVSGPHVGEALDQRVSLDALIDEVADDVRGNLGTEDDGPEGAILRGAGRLEEGKDLVERATADLLEQR